MIATFEKRRWKSQQRRQRPSRRLSESAVALRVRRWHNSACFKV